MDLSQYSDQELEAMLGGGDLSSYSDQELEAMLVEDAPQQDVTGGEAFRASFAEGVPFGKTVMSGVAGLTAGALSPHLTIPEAYALAREELTQEREVGKEAYPYTSGAGTATGVIGSAAMLPAKMLKGGSLAIQALKAGAASVPYGAGYGYDQGEKGSLGNAIQQGAIAAPMGAGGAVAANMLIRGGGLAYDKVGKPLTERAMRYLDRVAGRKGANVGVRAGGQEAARATSQQVSDLSQDAIPLTAGDLSQDAAQQSLEYNALARVYGDDAALQAQKVREAQSGAAEKVLSKAAGSEVTPSAPYESARMVRDTLESAYSEAKKQTRAAYKKVGEMQKDAPLQVAADYVKKTAVAPIKDWARKGSSGIGFDLKAKGMGEAKRLYNEALMFDNMKSLNSVNYNKLQQWRGRVSQALRDAKNNLPIGVTDSTETTFLSGMIDRFDGAIKELPANAIKNGDDAILDAMAAAAAKRSQQGKLFEKNKIIMDVLSTKDITNESLAHALFTSGGKSAMERAANFEKILKASGEKAPELLSAFKQGVYGNVLKRSLGQEVTQGGKKMISFNKLATELNKLVNENPTLFKMMHPSETERKIVKDALEAANRIKSKKVGVVNYSNSAYKILEMLDAISPTAARMKVPLTDLSAESLLKTMGEESAKKQLNTNFSGIVNDKLPALYGEKYKFLERFAPATAAVSLSRPQE